MNEQILPTFVSVTRSPFTRCVVPRYRRLITSPYVHLLALTLGLVAYRLCALEMVSRSFLECKWCLSTRAVPHELQFVLLLLTMHLVSGAVANYSLRLLMRLVVVASLFIATVDLGVTQQFWVRLTASDFWKFAGEISAISSFVQQLWKKPELVSLLIIGALVWLVVSVRYLRSDWAKVPSLVLCALFGLGVVVCNAFESHEYHEVYVENSLETFFSAQSSKTPYSTGFENQIRNEPQVRKTCSSDLDIKPDTILVVFESLSMYHSALFSGLHNWMPEFDAMSQEGTRFSSFYANGVTSEQGLVSLLTGEPPIEKGEKLAQTLFEEFRTPKHSVPQVLRENGYENIFLTTGNLGFLNKGVWLKDIGFGTIEGHDAPFYKGMERYQFDAAPDAALYGRALQVLEMPRVRPVFMALETVSTHLPNVDPITGTHSQELTLRYADHQLGEFVRSLKSRGFFEHGNLIVTADHRAMVPMADAEMSMYGDRGFARIPLTIIGKGVAKGVEVTKGFSQTDLLPSLSHLTGHGTHCMANDQGTLLPVATHAPRCIFTQRSYSKNDVIAQCASSDFKVHLNGDQTSLSDAIGSPSDVLNVVHRLRMGDGF